MKTNTKIKPRFDINKNSLSSDELSKELLGHIKLLMKKQYEGKTESFDLYIALSSVILLTTIMSFTGVLFLGLPVFLPVPAAAVSLSIAYFASKYFNLRIIKKSKENGKSLANLISFCKNQDLLFLYIKQLESFNNKYNFNKIKKALDSHDFQSPDLTPYINDFFDFTQKDLKELNNEEIKLLFGKVKQHPKMARKILKSIKKDKPIRKINAKYFLDKLKKKEKNSEINNLIREVSILDDNIDLNNLSSKLDSVLLTPQKEYMDII